MRNKLVWVAACAGCIASIAIFFSAGGVKPLQSAMQWTSWQAQTAAIFFVQSITIAQIQDTYHGAALSPTELPKKVRVLIVPGHQPDVGGTELNGVYERDVVVDIADALAALFARNSHYEVTVARTKTEWNPVLQEYFDTHTLEINTFLQSQKAQMESHLGDGSILPAADQVYHNTAQSKAVLQLYGINKWASENAYDITLHLHINDYAGRRGLAKKYTGFAIYVPDRQYSNAEASIAIGEAIAGRLNAYHATSTLPKEDAGVVEDQKLIAIGSNNSADDASILIEYGYIFEPQFQNAAVRPVAINDYAYETYVGLQDFFKDPISSTYGSLAFPYAWSALDTEKDASGAGTYALQSALHYLGYYPPLGKSLNTCPITGSIGSCTRSALSAYQKAHGLLATGTLGPRTQAALEADLPAP